MTSTRHVRGLSQTTLTSCFLKQKPSKERKKKSRLIIFKRSLLSTNLAGFQKLINTAPRCVYSGQCSVLLSCSNLFFDNEKKELLRITNLYHLTRMFCLLFECGNGLKSGFQVRNAKFTHEKNLQILQL